MYANEDPKSTKLRETLPSPTLFPSCSFLPKDGSAATGGYERVRSFRPSHVPGGCISGIAAERKKEQERRKEEHPRSKKPNTKKIAGRLRSLRFLRMSPRFWTHMEVVNCYPLGFEHSEQFSPSTVFSRFTICTPKHWWNGSFLAK